MKIKRETLQRTIRFSVLDPEFVGFPCLLVFFSLIILSTPVPASSEATSKVMPPFRPAVRGELTETEKEALTQYWKPFSEETPRLQDAAILDAVPFQTAVNKALTFIVENQNPDGSWGNATNTKRVNIYAPIPSAHLGYRAGSTALVVCGLCEWENKAPDTLKPTITEAIDKAQSWLIKNMPLVKRSGLDCTYNNWAHGYSLSAFVRLYKRAEAKNQIDLSQQLIEQMKIQIDRLVHYEFVNGGWAYYDFDYKMAKPAGSPASFVTSMALVSLHEAVSLSIPENINGGQPLDVPQTLIDRAIASLLRQQKPDFSYLYGEYLNTMPNRGVNRPSGSLARSQSCNVALYYWTTLQTDENRETLKNGGKVAQTAVPISRFVTQQIMTDYLDRFVARIGWLNMGRKHSVPHDAFNQVAGYFYYYGHLYASQVLIELENPDDQKRLARHLVNILEEVQDGDGSYWDFTLYNYHQFYGTGMALVSLGRCESILGPEVNNEINNEVKSDVVNTDVVNTDVVNTDVVNTDIVKSDDVNTDEGAKNNS